MTGPPDTAQATPRPGGTLLFSPHLDDVAMCGYYAIASGSLPRPRCVATAFSVSNYMVLSRRGVTDMRVLSKILNPAHLPQAFGRWKSTAVGRPPAKRIASMLASLLDTADVARISSLRQAEDRRACAAMGAAQLLLGLDERKLRSPKAVLDPGRPLERDSQKLAEATKKVKEVIRSQRPTVVVCPWPHGPVQHFDHRLVYAACASATSSEGVPLWLLDDLPYGRRPLTPTNNPEKGVIYAPSLVKASEAMRRNKHRVMDLYPSQWSEVYHRAVDVAPPGDAGPSETLWLPS